MLANVFAKTLRDRWLGWVVAVSVVGSFVWLGMLAYEGIDLSVLETFPEAYRSLIGLRPGMDAGALAISAIYGTYGSLTFAAMALSMGAAAIAGEERKGTIGLLMANPKSRTSVLLSKMGALVVLSVLATAGMWALAVATPAAMGVGVGDLNVFAINVHMLAIVLFNGLLALAIGSATGNRGAALGVTVFVLVVGFLGAGLLPMLEWGEDWVKVFPWYYFNGSEPLYNGVDWEHIAILGGASLVFAVAAIVGINRRDFKGQSVGTTMIDRLRAIPVTKKLADAFAGGARVSSIWFKTASEYQFMLLLVCSYMFIIGPLLGWFYSAIPAETFEVWEQLPEGVAALFELFGGGDLTTPEGFVQIETFGMMAPIMVMVVTIAIGAGAVAGEEAKRTMGLLLANPISRGRIIAEKTWTMVLYGSVVGFVAFIGTWLGSLAGDLGMDVWNMASICILVTLVGIVGGALALAIGSAIGRKGVAVWGAVGAMVSLHVMNSLGEIAGNPWWQKLSPFYYYLGGDPLNQGLDWAHAAVLAALAVVFIAASFPLFQWRDVREKA
jgi:ABC-2 type transport system permease protein